MAPHTFALDGNPNDETPPRRRSKRSSRRKVRLAAILIATVCVLLLHGPALQAIGTILVVDELSPLGESAWTADGMLVLEGGAADADGRHDEGARSCRENGIRQVLLMQLHPEPVVRSGVVPPPHLRGRRALTSAGVPDQRIEVIPGDAGNRWQEARQLEAWLKARPRFRLVVLVHRLRSRHQRAIYDSILDPAVATRIRVLGLKGNGSNEANWWKSRHGVKSFMFAALELAHGWCFGECAPNADAWDPDQYEQSLRESLSQETPDGRST